VVTIAWMFRRPGHPNGCVVPGRSRFSGDPGATERCPLARDRR
jgi:hypothetical protein